MTPFDPITDALQDWFDKPLVDLPEVLRVRLRQDFFPLTWDDLTPSQRRSFAEQWDYQNDPAKEAENQFWWDFHERKRGLKVQIAQWEAAATPTASDLAIKEDRLRGLRADLMAMEGQERLARGDYVVATGANRGDSDGKSPEQHPAPTAAPLKYVAYPIAMHQLKLRHGASPEELAAWIFWGPDQGGIAAYMNANELVPPPRFRFIPGDDSDDYVSPLMGCWFEAGDVETFEPRERYLTGHQLCERWGLRGLANPAAFVRAKIRESRLSDMHPYYGITAESSPTEWNSPTFPPLESGLFEMSRIRQIEAVDFPKSETEAKGNVTAPPEAVAASAESVLAVVQGGKCAVFRQMENLQPQEIRLTFVGDRAEGGLAASNLLEVAARGVSKRLTLSELDLTDRRTGKLNRQAAVLLGLAHGKRIQDTGNPIRAVMTRVRKVFEEHLGVKRDPFQPYRPSVGWEPLFEVMDKRGAADARAARDAAMRTVSLDELRERGGDASDARSNPNESEDDGGDAADNWLRKNDPDL